MAVCSLKVSSFLKRAAACAVGVAAVFAAGGARAAAPAEGAYFHVDASKLSSMTFVAEKGTNFITRWDDAGTSRYASQDSATFRPWLGRTNGLYFVDFGPGQSGTSGTSPTGYLKWSFDDTSIREVFLVYSDYPGASGSFLLGRHNNYYDFHRNGKKLFHPTYASANIRNGLIEVDGESVDNATYELPEGFHIIHLRTTGNVSADRFASDRDKYKLGAQRLQEVLVYNSVLSGEAATNTYEYLRDKWASTPDMLRVAGAPQDIGTVNPAYGTKVGIAAGESFTVSAPAVWTNDAANVAATCTGWKLYDVDGNQVDADAGNSFTYTHPTPAAYRLLVWQWTFEYKATASADAGATVSVSEQWVKAGGRFTTVATVTDPATQAVSRWLDGADNVVSRDATLNVTITEPMSFTAKLGGARYVGSGATDYPSVAEALVGIRDYDTIFIRTGTHSMTNVCSITNAVTVRSVSGDADDVILTVPAKAGRRHFIMNNAEAALVDLTLANGSEANSSRISGGSVLIQSLGGRISHCVFSNNVITTWAGKGGAIAMSSADALVDHCTFIGNCSANTDTGNGGNAVSVGSGTVRNCLFVRNGDRTRAPGKCGTVYMSGGTIENCTFANNADKTCAGISVDGASVTIKNCVFYGADCPSAGSELQKIMNNTSYSNRFSYCCAPVLINDGGTCIASTAPFVDAAHEDWTPAAIVVDKGAKSDWMTDATDLADNPRVSGSAPDIGCYERDQSGFGASIELSATSGPAPFDVTFTVTSYGDVSEGVTCHWDWDGNGSWDATSTGTTNHIYQVGTFATKVKVVNNAKPSETYEPDYPFAITVVPKTIYVDDDSTDPVSPYGDPAHAARTVADAFSVAKDGCEIVITNGTYSFASMLEVGIGVAFRGWTGNPSDVILTMPKDNAGYRHFILNHAKASLSGLTLTNAYQNIASGENGGAVLIRALGGSVSNCVFANNFIAARHGTGGAVYVGSANSLVTHCTFTGNRIVMNDTNNGGNALGMGSGNVRNCLFVGNGKRDFSAGKCGTVYMSGGTLENCTFANNADKTCAGISVGNANATIRNCVFYGEDCASPATELGKIVYNQSNTNRFYNCCASKLINDGGTCIVSDNPFVDAAHGDWTPAAVIVDKGAKSDWMTGATDLAGNPRISGDYPDIGCYEKDQNQFSASVEASVTSGLSPCEVTFTVTTYGLVTAGVTCYWDWDGDGKWDDTSTGTTNHIYETGTYATKVKVVNNAKPSETYQPDAPFALSIVPKTIYVDDDSAEPVSPYGDPAHAARSVADAFAVAKDGCEIVISNGTYSFASTLDVETGVKFRSWTGNPADVILTMPKDNAGYRHFILNNADASLSGLTLTNAYQNIASGESGGSVLIRAFGGSISNCVFANNLIAARHGKGGAVYVGSANSLVSHCTFTGNRIDMNDTNNGGYALGMGSGNVRNCLFVGNGKRDFSAGVCGTVYISGGTLENCTFVNNADKTCAGISVGSASAAIRNCVFYGEDCTSPATELGKIVYNQSNTNSFYNCCASQLINDGGTCIVSDNPFVDAAHGDWTPAGVIVDKGVESAWMTDATDLAGNPRISGDYPDIGCYEKDQSKFSASVEPSATSGIGPLEVAFTVTAYGEISEGITCYWDWDGDGEWDAETDGTTSHTYQVGAYSTKVKVVNKAKPSEIYEPESAFALTVVPKTIYVDVNGEDPVWPYGDLAHAATNVADAYATAVDGCEIVICNGTYVMSSTIEMVKGVRFRSRTGNPADVVLAMPDKTNLRHFIVNHADGAFFGLTFTNGAYNVSNGNGGSFVIGALGGTISNCVFNGNSIPAWEGRGGAISMSSARALVTHCTFMRNRVANTGTNSGGTTIGLGNGIVRNCLFVGNGDRTYGSGRCGTIYATGGTVESCTFVTNADKYCAGVSIEGANVAVRNCIFYGADCPSAGSDELKKIVKDTSYANKFSHCCAPVSVGSDCVVTNDLQFRNEARGDYRLRASSPAVDKGLEQPWMTGATDLSGRPRIIHKIPDIGCYEAPGSGFTLIVR